MKKRALVLASSATCTAVSECVDDVHAVSSVQQALQTLVRDKSRKANVDVVVAALGTTRDAFLFRRNNKISLFQHAQRIGNMPRIVYSKTACRSNKTQALCFAAGADAVVSTPQHFKHALEVSPCHPRVVYIIRYNQDAIEGISRFRGCHEAL